MQEKLVKTIQRKIRSHLSFFFNKKETNTNAIEKIINETHDLLTKKKN